MMKQFGTINEVYHYLTDKGPSRYLFGDTPWRDDWRDELGKLRDMVSKSIVVGAIYKSMIDIPDYGEIHTLVEINRDDNGIWTLREQVDPDWQN